MWSRQAHKGEGLSRSSHCDVVQTPRSIQIFALANPIPGAVEHEHMVEFQPFCAVGGAQQQAALLATEFPSPFGEPLGEVIRRGFRVAGFHFVLCCDTGAREMLECLPDGIHSGLAREGEKGMFFYFTATGPRGEGRQHFWRYYDIKRDRVFDNRFLIANLIACSPDTPRLAGDCDIFAIQGKVIDDILDSVSEQQAVEAAPRILDPLQQTVITLLRGYLNSPAVQRAEVRETMQRLRFPLTHTAIRDLRRAYQHFQQDQNVGPIISHVVSMDALESDCASYDSGTQPPLRRKDLHLVCFDYIGS